MSEKIGFWKKINKTFKNFKWILTGVLIAFLGLFVYTPEYLNYVRLYLEDNITISKFLLYLMIVFILIIIFEIIERFSESIIFLNDKNEELNSQCLDLKYKLNSNLENKIKEDQSEKIQNVLENFVKNNSEVIAVQIYECIENRNKNIINYKVKLGDFKYVRANYNVNDVQEDYTIDERKLKKYHKIKKDYIDTQDENILSKYLKELTNRLNNKSKKDITITDSIIFDYCCLVLLYQNYLDENPFTLEDLDKLFQQRINDTKRNGILRGIIEKNFCKFEHSGKSNKNSRIYITKCLPIENIPHIFVITVNPIVIKRKDYSEFLDNLGEKFYNMLEKDSNLVYNNYKIS